MTMDWKKLLCDERPRSSTGKHEDRSQFERDFDRAIFSTPVKRLQDKAQVFPLEPHDAVRTRLTHSLEVSSVARGLATSVSKWLLDKKKIEPYMRRDIEAIAATCGLIHDLGNPPFGHSGEKAISHWFKTYDKENNLNEQLKKDKQCVEDFMKFDGNAQSLRLLTKLQILADFNGLNLTYGTLSASLKYTSPSHEIEEKGDHAKSKPGYFASENEIIEKIRENTGTGDARNPITYLVEAADDIVFSVADIEDAVKKGIFTWQKVEQKLRALEIDTMNEVLDSAKGMIETVSAKSGLEELPDDVYASAFRTSVIALVVKAVVEKFKNKYDEIMQGRYKGELVEDCTAGDLVKGLKEFGENYVYCTPSNLKLELMGRHVICGLMDIFWEAARELSIEKKDLKPKTFPGKIGKLFSGNYLEVFYHSIKDSKLPEQYHRFQLVTDYISGMTDTFAKRLHAELTNG